MRTAVLQRLVFGVGQQAKVPGVDRDPAPVVEPDLKVDRVQLPAPPPKPMRSPVGPLAALVTDQHHRDSSERPEPRVLTLDDADHAHELAAAGVIGQQRGAGFPAVAPPRERAPEHPGQPDSPRGRAERGDDRGQREALAGHPVHDQVARQAARQAVDEPHRPGTGRRRAAGHQRPTRYQDRRRRWRGRDGRLGTGDRRQGIAGGLPPVHEPHHRTRRWGP